MGSEGDTLAILRVREGVARFHNSLSSTSACRRVLNRSGVGYTQVPGVADAMESRKRRTRCHPQLTQPTYRPWSAVDAQSGSGLDVAHVLKEDEDLSVGDNDLSSIVETVRTGGDPRG